MKENMEYIEKTIKEKFPECHVEIDGPTQGNYWFLNADFSDDHHVALEWRPDSGFNLIANREAIPFEGGDEFFDDLEKTTNRVIELLESKEPTCHPLEKQCLPKRP